MDNQEVLNEITKSLETENVSMVKQTEITNKVELNKEIRVYFIHQTAFLDYVYKFLYKLFLILLIFGWCFILIICWVNYFNSIFGNSNNYQPTIQRFF